MTLTIKRFQTFTLAAIAVSISAILPTHAFATAVPLTGGGVLNIANATGALVGVSSSCIDWGYPAPCQTLTGIPVTVGASDSNLFVANSSTSSIKDIPFAVSLPLVAFKQIQSPLPGGFVYFDLTGITVPAPPAVNDCTSGAVSSFCWPGNNSPFLLYQATANQVFISFATTERAYTGSSTTGSTPYEGIFTTQLSGTLLNGQPATIPNVLNYIAAGGTVTATWSSQESPVPQSPPPPPPFSGCTVTQGGWGAPAHGNNPGAFLDANFATAFPSGDLIGRLPSFYLLFDSAAAVRAFLPQGGPPGALTANATDPTTQTSAGVLAGQVLALSLNVKLYGLGSLTLTGTGTSLDGHTVSDILAAANIALGGGPLPAGFTYSSLNDLIDQLNSSFDGCVADSWALTHLH